MGDDSVLADAAAETGVMGREEVRSSVKCLVPGLTVGEPPGR